MMGRKPFAVFYKEGQEKAILYPGKQAKLNEDDVREIRKRHKEGETQKKLAKEYNISPATVWSVVTRYTWKHVD